VPSTYFLSALHQMGLLTSHRTAAGLCWNSTSSVEVTCANNSLPVPGLLAYYSCLLKPYSTTPLWISDDDAAFRHSNRTPDLPLIQPRYHIVHCTALRHLPNCPHCTSTTLAKVLLSTMQSGTAEQVIPLESYFLDEATIEHSTLQHCEEGSWSEASWTTLSELGKDLLLQLLTPVPTPLFYLLFSKLRTLHPADLD
jgi:hypothetical protein